MFPTSAEVFPLATTNLSDSIDVYRTACSHPVDRTQNRRKGKTPTDARAGTDVGEGAAALLWRCRMASSCGTPDAELSHLFTHPVHPMRRAVRPRRTEPCAA